MASTSFGIIFCLMVFSVGSYGAVGDMEKISTYSVRQIKIDPLPSLFSEGEIKIAGRVISVFGREEQRSPDEKPFFSIVGNAQKFLLHRDGLLQDDKVINYSFDSRGKKGFVSAMKLDPFRTVFACNSGVDLRLHVVLSPDYGAAITTQKALEAAYLQGPLVQLKFEEIR